MTSTVDDFEAAFQSLMTAVVSPSPSHTHDSEEVKTSVDQTVSRFLDAGKGLEAFFLQKRLYLSAHHPEQLIAEDINDIKIEIQRKENVIQKTQEKLQHWMRILSDQPMVVGGPTQMGPGVTPGVGPGISGHPLAGQIMTGPGPQGMHPTQMTPNIPHQMQSPQIHPQPIHQQQMPPRMPATHPLQGLADLAGLAGHQTPSPMGNPPPFPQQQTQQPPHAWTGYGQPPRHQMHMQPRPPGHH